jgi:uncharacterized protein UPF0047
VAEIALTVSRLISLSISQLTTSTAQLLLNVKCLDLGLPRFFHFFHDYELWLEKLAPHAPSNADRHNRTGEDNADAYLKCQILGREVVVAITKGKLDFGP